jgi:hypothetical protein
MWKSGSSVEVKILRLWTQQNLWTAKKRGKRRRREHFVVGEVVSFHLGDLGVASTCPSLQ